MICLDAPKSLDELDVFSLSARLVQDAKVSLALVQSFGAFAKTTSKTVVNLYATTSSVLDTSTINNAASHAPKPF